MTPSISLRTYQEWMLSVLEHPGTDQEAWNSSGATSHLSYDRAFANVVPSATLTPIERVAIYRRMFYLRMTDAMEIDYPGVLHVVGKVEFRRLIAREYVRQHPSSSYTLNAFGRWFPEFLRNSGRADATFLSGLARLELTISELMDKEEPEVQWEGKIADEILSRLDSATVTFIPAFALHNFTYPVGSYLQSVLDGEPAKPPLVPSSTWVVVYRRDFVMHFKEINRDEFSVLSDLREGKSVGEAITKIVQGSDRKEEELAAEIFRWFASWSGEGFIQRIG